MKTTNILSLAGLVGYMLAAFTACNNGLKGYVINGQVEGLDDGTVVTLVPMSHDNDSALAEATVKDGKFQFTGVAEEPICARINVKDAWGGAYVMLEPAEINVDGKIAGVEEAPSGKIYNWDVKITGSPLTDKLAAFDARHDSLDILYREYHEKYDEAYKKMHTLKGAELAAFQKTEEYKAANEAEKNFFDTVESTIMGMVNDNKDSFWGPLLLIKYMNYFDKSQADLYNSLPDDVKNSFYGKKMQMEIWPELAIADQVKAFKLKGDDGTEYDFAKLAEGKKYVLLDFWASWCGPCRRELPNVKKAYADFKDKGFGVVSISIDQKEEDWKKALDEEKMEWPNFRSQEVADQFKVKAVPTVYLCDAEGNIVAANEECRGEALAAKLKELLK